MISGTDAGAIPMEQALAFRDRDVVDAGMALSYVSGIDEQPILVAMWPPPLAASVVILINEPYRDTVV